MQEITCEVLVRNRQVSFPLLELIGLILYWNQFLTCWGDVGQSWNRREIPLDKADQFRRLTLWR